MKPTLLIACLFISCLVTAQKESSPIAPGQMSIYAELGGSGILFSINFDSRFTKSPLGFGGRVGVGFVGDDNYDYTNQSVLTFPIQVNYIFGKPHSVHSFEVGAGLTFSAKKIDLFGYQEGTYSSVYGTACFMYRRLPKDGGFFWRAGFTPILGSGYVFASAGVSIGYIF